MIKALVLVLFLIGIELSGFAQISSRYYLPHDTLLKQLNVSSLTCTTYWTENKKGKTEIRQDHIQKYNFDLNGKRVAYLSLNQKDSSILDKWTYKYDEKDSLIEFIRSDFGKPDVPLTRETYNYQPLNNGWLSIVAIDSSLIASENKSLSIIRDHKFVLVKDHRLIADSVIRIFNNLPPRIVVKYYFYRNDGSYDYILHKIISTDTIRLWKKQFVYDVKGRIEEIYSDDNGKKKTIETWYWNDEKNELKIYSKSAINKKKQIEYFKYDSLNRLIKYSNDLNDEILRTYEMSYYENNLLKQLVTIAPKDDWTHTQDYHYSYR